MGLVSVFESTRLALARLAVLDGGELQRGLLQAAQVSARAMDVRRVGIWFFSEDGSAIVCTALWDEGLKQEHRGRRLELQTIPSYAAALRSRRVVLAHDARTAPETRELSPDYLEPHGITSLLDAPVYSGGEVIGVACHEHVGPARVWTDRERDLAASVADVVAVLLEQAAKVDMEAALRKEQARAAVLEREVALGRLCAGVAHDFNNVLAAIVLQLDLVRQAPDALRRAHAIADAVESADAGRRIVGQLLTYARAGEGKGRAVNVGQVLRARRALLDGAVGAGHELELEIAPDRMIVEVDPALLDQLLLNLVTNARDAMPDGGRVRVVADADDAWVKISVEDRGAGIDEAILPKIFEPFFTTKGEGTGLGLSTVKRITEAAGGRVDLWTRGGEGTKVTAVLPRISG